MKFWRGRGREPILIRKEIKGFVAGRLAWSLLREAIHLVNEDIVTAEELDRIIESSMGKRWRTLAHLRVSTWEEGLGVYEACLEMLENPFRPVGMMRGRSYGRGMGRKGVLSDARSIRGD
jgi:3-hydroxyacyl-CoA dehydrogenase